VAQVIAISKAISPLTLGDVGDGELVPAADSHEVQAGPAPDDLGAVRDWSSIRQGKPVLTGDL